METEKLEDVIRSSSVLQSEDAQPDETIHHEKKEEDITDRNHEEKEEEMREIKASPSPIGLEKVSICCFSQIFGTSKCVFKKYRKEQTFAGIYWTLYCRRLHDGNFGPVSHWKEPESHQKTAGI